MKRLTLTFGLVLVAIIAAACSSSTAAPPASQGPVDPNAPVVVAKNNLFSPAEVKVTAEKAFTLRLDNQDSAPHNVAIFTDSSAATSISIGEIVSSKAVDQQVPALAAGTYFFRCDVHKEMTGSIVAE